MPDTSAHTSVCAMRPNSNRSIHKFTHSNYSLSQGDFTSAFSPKKLLLGSPAPDSTSLGLSGRMATRVLDHQSAPFHEFHIQRAEGRDVPSEEARREERRRGKVKRLAVKKSRRIRSSRKRHCSCHARSSLGNCWFGKPK